ncbi:ADP-ribosylation factor-like protein 13A isoform X2 [Clupea harengus]|uniref:ADP-ribosylation factor-like protein 13A isoform X2 n=1 Tax=Clupea harengus TaxID=7950 RepID=A0A6P8GX61_CLUHA|nr:ADP-ribosylation factor-like protein 13A isoform X2 [Clupea harengus]
METGLLLYDLKRRWWPLCSPELNMFNLIGNCCSWVSKFQQPLRKVTVLVVGLDNAGKTCSIRGMLGVPPGEVGPTLGCVRTELRVENFLVTMVDMGGVLEDREAWTAHYGEAHAIIFVVDSSDRARIKEVKDEMVDILKQPRVAGKPLLVLANKQDKVNAMLGSELIEILSLEHLVNKSRSLCHIEPCSALLDLRRWSDRKTLRGLRWLLRAVCLDYSDLCVRVIRDSRRPYGHDDREKRGKAEKGRRKTKEQRLPGSKSDLRQEKTRKSKGSSSLQPIRDILNKENSLKKRLTNKKVKGKTKKENAKNRRDNGNDEEEVEEGEAAEEAEQEHNSQKEKASSPLLPGKQGKLKRKSKVKKETLDLPESLDTDDSKPSKGKGEKKKKRKTVKVKRKNKINTEVPAAYTQPVDLSTTFARQEQEKEQEQEQEQDREREPDQGLER